MLTQSEMIVVFVLVEKIRLGNLLTAVVFAKVFTMQKYCKSAKETSFFERKRVERGKPRK